MTVVRVAAIAVSLCLTAFGPAVADAIDGHWCQTERLRLSINGPSIVTPGGARMTGDYTRHSFIYVAPSADWAAGQTVAMSLVNDEIMHLRSGDTPATTAQSPAQVWRRCAAPIS